MRLVTFAQGTRFGALLPDAHVVELTDVVPGAPSVVALLRAGPDAMRAAAAHVAAGGGGRLPLGELTLTAPVPEPGKVLCVGMNYREHCIEQDFPIPDEPVVFSKFGSAVTGPNDDVVFDSRVTRKLDYEVELAVVIGSRAAKDVRREDALSHVAGVTVAHDVSARDWQLERNGGQWLLGKTMDTFCPLGPALVTLDELRAAGLTLDTLRVTSRLNGQTVQDSNTSEFIFDVPAIIAWVTRFVTLHAGDVILTGTPSGVGCFRKPPLWLKHGDRVEVEVEGVGVIRNRMVDRAVVESKTSGGGGGGGVPRAQRAPRPPQPPSVVPMMVGGYTTDKGFVQGQGKGVYPCALDLRTGAMTLRGPPVQMSNPTYVCLSGDGRTVHAVSEDALPEGGQLTGTVSSFEVCGGAVDVVAEDGAAGATAAVATPPTFHRRSRWVTGGTDPCYCELDRRERFLFVANYSSGSVSVFPVRPDRSLGPRCGFRQHTFYPENTQPGPVADRQEGPHAHQARLMEPNDDDDAAAAAAAAAAGRKRPTWLYAPDLGTDRVVQYVVDMSCGSLEEVAAHPVAPGSGPRHMDWLPDRSCAYVSLEMGNGVSVQRVDPDTGALAEVQVVPTLPADFVCAESGPQRDACPFGGYPSNSVAHVVVHPSGRFVYASNRGHDSIACFAVGADGRLTAAGHFSSQGLCPRNFAFDAHTGGGICVVCNQNSHDLFTYRVDGETGALQPTGQRLSVPSPSCVALG